MKITYEEAQEKMSYWHRFVTESNTDGQKYLEASLNGQFHVGWIAYKGSNSWHQHFFVSLKEAVDWYNDIKF